MTSRADAVHDITNLIYGYAEALDRGDLEAVGACFEHCTIRVDGLPNMARGTAEVLEFFKPVIFYKGNAVAAQGDPDSVPATRHLTTNLIIHVGDDLRTATAKSYFTVIQGRPDFPLQPVIAGRYHDRFECVDRRWRFSERLEFIDLVGDLSRHLTMTIPAK